ncbi:hypothetical protein PENTCL1PPCAC_22189 [Pristionchus entomophagus]|uniref:Uncharacterized protein n=1 Tax=Pristionchus entomophagus TaxID=358040 RepID=A0AAV5U1I0_9BILA|nr:hypothetical protein PENTCL1PPCAC_22189 [Pristionchus entomophagus]
MLSMWFTLSLLPFAWGSCGNWREDDEFNHGCRTCRDIDIDLLANCPETGYACDERESIRATVLSASDPCTCKSLRCANKGWRLAVNRTIVDQVHCKRGQWFWSGFPAPSIVCGKPTSPGIPATQPPPTGCPALQPAELPACEAYLPSFLICVTATLATPTVGNVMKCGGTGTYVRVGAGPQLGGPDLELLCDPVLKQWTSRGVQIGSSTVPIYVACITV